MFKYRSNSLVLENKVHEPQFPLKQSKNHSEVGFRYKKGFATRVDWNLIRKLHRIFEYLLLIRISKPSKSDTRITVTPVKLEVTR